MSKYLLGFDLGGSGVRCLLLDVTSKQTYVAARSWDLMPAPGVDGFAFDLDLDLTWKLAGEVVREALQRANATADAVVGIAATAFRGGIVALDEHGEVLLAAPNVDGRGAAETVQVGELLGEALRQTGRPPSPISSLCRLLGLKSQDPQRFARVRQVLGNNEWLALRMTGQAATESTQACETQLYSLQGASWADDILARTGIPRAILPPLRHAGDVLGTITEDAARDLGLRAGTPVAVGCADTAAAMLAVLDDQIGCTGVIAGSTTPIQLTTPRPIVDPAGRLWAGPSVAPGAFVVESSAGCMGMALDWFASLMFAESGAPVAELVAQAERSFPGAGGVLSSGSDDVMDASKMLLPMGHLSMSQFVGRGGAERRQHVARAVLEGMAYAVRANIEQCETLGQRTSTAVVLAGGLSRSPLWCQIVADVLGRPIQVAACSDTSALGAAMIAGVAAGTYADPVAAARGLRAEPRTVAPGPHSDAYGALYQQWQDVRQVRRPLDETAAAVAVGGVLEDIAAAQPQQSAGGSKRRLLVTADLDDTALARLREHYEVDYAPFRGELVILQGDELVERARDVDAIVTEVDLVEREVLRQLPKLRAVGVCRVNAVNVDVDGCTALNIPVVYTPGRNAVGVGELTIALMLQLLRKLAPAAAFMREPGAEAGDNARQARAFETFRGRELGTVTVGLVGFGSIGRAVAARLRAFGTKILVADPFTTADQAARAGAQLVSLGELLAGSDIVSLHANVSEATRHLIGSAELAQMKRGAMLVNTARAALVDEAALVTALRSGQLGGAGLDVFVHEPPAANDPLLTLDNVIATPHIGGNTADVPAHQGAIIADQMIALARQQRPQHLLNPQAWSAFRWDRKEPTSTAALDALGAGAALGVSDFNESAPDAPAAAAASPTTAMTVVPNNREVAIGVPSAAPVGWGARMRAWLERRRTRKLQPKPAPNSAAAVQFTHVIEKFVEGVAKDEALARFSEGRDVMVHYVVSDLDLQYHMRFANGSVTGQLGAPAEQAPVRLRMSAEIMDKTLSGAMNPARAAMTGKLAFSGNTRVAMSLQRIQKDMCRIYSAAREQAVGSVVLDLSNVGAATAPNGANGANGKTTRVNGKKAAGRPAAPGAEQRLELVAVVEELYRSGVITSTGGNVSIRIPDTQRALITPSALFKGELKPEMMVEIDITTGEQIDPDSLPPSSERMVHCAVLRARPDVQAVVHAHPPNAIVLADTELPFTPICTESAFIGEIPRVPFIMPGTPELASEVARMLGAGPVVLLKNHGILVGGSSLRRAADLLEIVERTSQVILGCYSAGKQPLALPPDAVTTLREMQTMIG